MICHHVACAFGDVGAWYYIVPPPADSVALLPFSLFAAVNQSFFMSLLFFLSGYFTARAHDRKGTAAFLRDRGIRLGIPLAAWFLLLNPHVEYLARRLDGGATGGYTAWMRSHWLDATGSGPLWFVFALLLFTVAYVAWGAIRPADAREVRVAPLPRHGQILAFVGASSVVAFALRLAFPVGTTVAELQLGYFALYVAFFALGIVAHRRSWLEQLGPDLVRPWLRAAGVLVVAMPVAVTIGGGEAAGAAPPGPDPFLGGWSWQAFAYAAWEPVLCVGISLALLHRFHRRFQVSTPLGARASRSAYTVYILHPFFVVAGTGWLAGAPLDPLLKFAILCPLAVLTCFAVSDVVRRAPLVRRVV